jgi:hypothetical protein
MRNRSDAAEGGTSVEIGEVVLALRRRAGALPVPTTTAVAATLEALVQSARRADEGERDLIILIAAAMARVTTGQKFGSNILDALSIENVRRLGVLAHAVTRDTESKASVTRLLRSAISLALR